MNDLDIVEELALLSALAQSESKITIMLAPNFEERSVQCAGRILDILAAAQVKPDRVRWVVLTLQGQHATEILDAMKAVNTRLVIDMLNNAGFSDQTQHRVIRYPVVDDKFVSELSQVFREMRAIGHLVVDYSALPRNLLSRILKQVSLAGMPDAALPPVGVVWLFYSWAESYPEAAGPEFLGQVVGHVTGLSTRELLEGKTHAEIVVFTSGSTHDAYSTVESAHGSRLGHEIRVHLVNFMNHQNFQESHLNLRNHYGMIRDARPKGVDVRYVFTIRHALAFMREIAVQCARQRNLGDRTLFLIGPFGPKPLGVAAHFVRHEYLASLQARQHIEADVLDSEGSQYLSPYSLGAGPITVFRYLAS